MIKRGLLSKGAGDERVAGRVRDVLEAETSNEGQFHYRQGVLVATGFHPDLGALGWQDRSGVLMVGLYAAGQTTIIYKLNLGEMVTTIATIGRKVETVEYKNLSFATRSAGGQDRIQPRRRQYYRTIHGLVYIVDSKERERIEEANEELINMLNEDE